MATLMMQFRNRILVYEKRGTVALSVVAEEADFSDSFNFLNFGDEAISDLYKKTDMPDGMPVEEACRLMGRCEGLELVTLNGSVVWSLKADEAAALHIKASAAN